MNLLTSNLPLVTMRLSLDLKKTLLALKENHLSRVKAGEYMIYELREKNKFLGLIHIDETKKPSLRVRKLVNKYEFWNNSFNMTNHIKRLCSVTH